MKIIKHDIHKVNLSKKTHNLQGIWKSYLLSEAGQEHYKLLAYLAGQLSNSLIIELGTFKGVSTIALGSNSRNRVITYDILDQRIVSFPMNVEFRLGDIFSRGEESELLDAPLIFLDTAHDGTFERKVYRYLLNHHYQGILLLDDITLNEQMSAFWNSIRRQKYDLTDVGHGAPSRFGTIPGTGLVDFSNDAILI